MEAPKQKPQLLTTTLRVKATETATSRRILLNDMKPDTTAILKLDRAILPLDDSQANKTIKEHIETMVELKAPGLGKIGQRILANDEGFEFNITLVATRSDWSFEPSENPEMGTITKAIKGLASFDMDGVLQYIEENQVKRVLVMCGAGISVAAGIPDFRTPGVGLYSRLEKYNLPYPEAVFTLDYLFNKPEIFYTVANDMKLWPGMFPPTHVHHFIKLLDERGLLVRCFTQNIDTLERTAGLEGDRVVEAHGSFATASCAKQSCKTPYDVDLLRSQAEKQEVPRCAKCGEVAKPDVVFFGEGLPSKFFEHLKRDTAETELLLIIGTSLKVSPFNEIPNIVPDHVPRVLINMERAGHTLVFPGEGQSFTPEEDSSGDEAASKDETVIWKRVQQLMNGPRDVLLQGDCQEVVRQLSTRMGFGSELDERYARVKAEMTAGSIPQSDL